MYEFFGLVRSRAVVRTCALVAGAGIAMGIAAPAAAQNISGVPLSGTVNLRTGFLPDPRIVAVRAGGPIDASRLGTGCTGFIPQRPSVRLNWGGGGSPLTISTRSNGDTVLAINGPDGRWYCNDDSQLDQGGVNAAVVFPGAPRGRYDIFVGTFGGSGPAPADLRISELVEVEETPRNVINLRTGFLPDPNVSEVYAGGDTSASERFGSNCLGSISRSPDFRVRFTAGRRPLILSATSRGDATLVVRAPDGTISCNDDFSGLNPLVRFDRPQSGDYDVWVGLLGEGPPQPGEFRVSEIPPRR